MNDYGYVDPIEAGKHTQEKLEEALRMCVEQFENGGFELDEFKEILKITQENYTEDTKRISFELRLSYYDGEMFLDLDEYKLQIFGERYGHEVFQEIRNQEANAYLYNKLLEFCK